MGVGVGGTTTGYGYNYNVGQNHVEHVGNHYAKCGWTGVGSLGYVAPVKRFDVGHPSYVAPVMPVMPVMHVGETGLTN